MTSPMTFDVIDGQPFVTLEREHCPLPALWLRERSQAASLCDPLTGQRLFNPHELPEDLGVESAVLRDGRLLVTYSDGFQDSYNLEDLKAAIRQGSGLPGVTTWSATDGAGKVFDWQKLRADSGETLACVEAFLARGFVILENTPTDRESILTVAGHFGHVRHTNFGRYFEVYSRPGSNDLAYRPVPLAPHTDNPYRNPVPGIQILHCLANETTGGHSTLVDGFRVCEQLQDEDPDGFQLLKETEIAFRFRDGGAHLMDRHPMIETDGLGRPTGIHYSPRLDETPLLDPEILRSFHRARHRLGSLLSYPENEFRFLLEQGQLMMFDNNRVLHGRTAYDPNEGLRHLQGCYIDRDGPESLYRMLSGQGEGVAAGREVT